MTTLADVLSQRSEESPDGLAVIDNGRSFTNRELYERVLRNNAELEEQGLAEGSTVLLQMSNSVATWVHLHSLIAKKCRIVPCASGLNDAERSAMRAQLTIHAELDAARLQLWEHYNTSCDTAEQDEACMYHFTSGSTDRPKICVRTIRQLMAEGASYVQTLRMTEADVVALALPLYHSYAFGFAFMGGVMSGAAVVLLDKFTPRQLIKELARHQATIVPLVPIMARSLSKLYLAEPVDLSFVRIMMVGAGPVTEELHQEIAGKYNVSISCNYGSTETGGIVSRLGSTRYRSAGKPMSGVRLSILNEHGEETAPFEEGHIWISSDSVMTGYLHEDEQPFNAEGYMPMGDLGFVDHEGYLFITGRTKAIANIGGKKVNPSVVVQRLLAYEKVEDAHVFARKKENGEDMLVAHVVPRFELTVQELIQYARTTMQDHQIPASIKLVGHIQRNEMGKIVKETVMG
ncbi:long-chain fatty acid--CoA ligase [Paenibacillus oenotherae]|uniref:Long-chain fatty acid--CoA ligase n=1 Tax=Paenibacillus oenotherae TaxID=1435645 RepID=A0ABS7D979_9BACL|nr:long-chain fatty acid--CoA ligase [Paenibacillus oenotherae]MBW7476504.1 long-chain fatty acid--CoA ligase [Paenibacillus oenotherae]